MSVATGEEYDGLLHLPFNILKRVSFLGLFFHAMQGVGGHIYW